MSKKKEEKEKQWTDHLEYLASSRDRSKVFDDFLTIIVCVLSMQQKEEIYLQTIKRYKKEEVETFAMAFARLVDWMETHPLEDAFGDYFQEYISRGHNGQFFTPPHVSDMMAQLILPSDLEGAMNDPCCGSGRFFLSVAKMNRAVTCIGGDISELCCKMTLVNLCLNDITGKIYHMDTLSMEIWRVWEITRYPLLRVPFIRELQVGKVGV